MIFLSTTKYNELLAKANRNDVSGLQKNHNIAIEKIKEDHKNEIKNYERKEALLKEDHLREITRIKADVDLEVRKATQTLEDKIKTLTIENESNKKEKEILTTAFKNLGFDVKDMKDILNKLVEGVVSKNTVQVIK